MLRLLASSLALVLAAVAALALGACGEEDVQLLPGETAREIVANLESVEDLADEGDCAGAEGAAQQVSEQIEALREVDRRLKRALEDGADRLEEVIAECEEPDEEGTAPAIDQSEEAEPSEDEAEDAQKRRKQAEKEREKAEKEAEERDEDEGPGPPPQSQGRGDRPDEGGDGGPSGGGGGEGQEEPSGGLSPGAPAGEAE